MGPRDMHAFVSLGSNLGHRANHLRSALALLRRHPLISVERHSWLYESAPQGLKAQPSFLNAGVLLHTRLSPLELLDELQSIERQLGRVRSGPRFGPRTIDLDILMLEHRVIRHERLEVPHPRLVEREFALRLLCDLDSNLKHPVQNQSVSELLGRVKGQGVRRVFAGGPGDSVWGVGNRTLVMGILNATPDSFSDSFSDGFLDQVAEMVEDQVDAIDVGGYSTRPGADLVSEEEENSRVIPVIRSIRKHFPEIAISIDTFRAPVARSAVAAGANMVNDVSGGYLDPDMHGTVAALKVPYVFMHMRGDPKSMSTLTDYGKDGVVQGVHFELHQKLESAVSDGVPSWDLIQDPGLGFAKSPAQSLVLLKHLNAATLSGIPVLLGPSRKRFIDHILASKHEPKNRDVASGAICASMCSRDSVFMVRMHNVKIAVESCKVAYAIRS